MAEHDLYAVTGAFGYSGRHVTERLLARGARVRSLTGHPDRPDPFGGRVEVVPFRFEDPAAMAGALRGARVLVNTYWVRFDHGAATFAAAVARSKALFRAAAAAGVERVVHVSITNPSADSPLPYFSGKAEVERALRASGLSHAILRPAVFFGGRDVLLNNIAWLLRRLPVFGVVPGDYGLRPVHVDDVAALVVEQAGRREDVTLDAVGPETFSYRELVSRVARAVGRPARLVPVPRAVLLATARVLGKVVGDVPLTPDEVAGLTANLLVTTGPATGPTRLSEWLGAHGGSLGRDWASELGRHYR